jgi:thiamine pyrophosphate-dependent acetolactate synthase large subunit-like protein
MREDCSFPERARDLYDQWWELRRRRAADPAVPMKPQAVTCALSEVIPDGAILTGDAGTVSSWGRG